MILKSTRVKISDNSGGKIAETIKITGKYATIGDVIVVSIKDAIPGKIGSRGFFLKKGEVCEVLKYYGDTDRHLDLQSLSPSYGNGNWVCEEDNVALAPEMLKVLS